jgi:hypothetical protein
MHWFNFDKAIPEMARVLTGGGVLGCLWNTMDEDYPWVRTMMRVSQSSVSTQRWRPAAVPVPAPPFSTIEREEFTHAHRRTARTMAETMATHSHILILDDEERSEIMGRLAGYLESCPETAVGEFDVPMVTLAVRAVRDS